MDLIDQILNLACVLLWLNWRSYRFNPLSEAMPRSLIGTLRAAESRRFRGWKFLLALILLLVFRAAIYWQIGPAAEWTPKMNLMFVALAFRSDNFVLALLYSVLSFGRALLILYVWLLTLTLINRRQTDPEAVQKLVRQQLGPAASWPWPIQIFLPFLLTAIMWLAIHPLLLKLNITNRPHSLAHLLEQGLLIGIATVFSLKYLIPLLLLIHLLTTYVYLGSNPIWEFINATGRNLLRPLDWLPLRIGKLDLAPALVILLAILFFQALPELGLRKMLEQNLRIWPQ